jgi:hypothetical protein
MLYSELDEFERAKFRAYASALWTYIFLDREVTRRSLLMEKDPKHYEAVDSAEKALTFHRWKMEDIRAANRAAGGFYFTTSNVVRFGVRFGCVYNGPSGTYLTTSDLGTDGWSYNILKFDPLTGMITGVCHKNTSRAAREYAARLARRLS